MASKEDPSLARVKTLSSHLNPNPTQVESSPYFEGNYKPVLSEISSDSLEVLSGAIPEGLSGYFVRVGPNSYFDFTGKPYHWFDGDGMAHSIKISGGKASYTNKWIKTKRLLADQKRGSSFSENAELMKGNFEVLPLLNDEEGKRMGKANTNVIVHAKKVLALDEQDRPYELHLPTLETVGVYTFNKEWDLSFTAHPKIDPVTKEMIFFGYGMKKRGPWYVHGVADKEGKIIRKVPVQLRHPGMIHDCAITQNYTIVFDFPLKFDMDEAMNSGSPWVFDENMPCRFGLLPRYSKDGKDVRWFDFKSGFLFHTFNAWEEGDKVILLACRSDFPGTFEANQLNTATGMFPHEYTFNLTTGQTSERRLISISGDFPSIDSTLLGRKNRFFYFVSMSNRGVTPAPFKHLIKYDRETNLSLIHTLEGGLAGGEFVFVPRPGRDPREEDDGFLVSFCHDERRGHSEFYVVDARSMQENPVVRIKLPQRVPWGFHGNWFADDEL